MAYPTITALNKYDLLQAESEEVKSFYQKITDPLAGSLTTVLDNDASSKFNVAYQELNPLQEQRWALEALQTAFQKIDLEIDPDRLNFYLSKAQDDEICINRRSPLGITTLIVHEDGTLALSFIALPESGVSDSLEFLDNPATVDWEKVAYWFFMW